VGDVLLNVKAQLCSCSLLQVSFSGCLIENLNNLADHDHIYAPGWNKTYSTAIHTLRTSGGFPKLDFVAFTYHHALTALIDRLNLKHGLGNFSFLME